MNGLPDNETERTSASIGSPYYYSLYMGHGVCSLLNTEILLKFRSELGSDAFPVITVDFSGI